MGRRMPACVCKGNQSKFKSSHHWQRTTLAALAQLKLRKDSRQAKGRRTKLLSFSQSKRATRIVSYGALAPVTL